MSSVLHFFRTLSLAPCQISPPPLHEKIEKDCQIKIIERTLEELNGIHPVNWPHLAALYEEAAEILEMSGDFEKSIKYYIHAAHCQLESANPIRAIAMLSKVSQPFCRQNPSSHSESWRRETLELLEDLTSPFLPDDFSSTTCNLFTKVASLYQALQGHECAAILFQKIAEYYEDAHYYPWAGRLLYKAGIELSYHSSDPAALEKAGQLFWKSARQYARVRDDFHAHKSLESAAARYRLLQSPSQEAACYYKIARRCYWVFAIDHLKTQYYPSRIKYFKEAAHLYVKARNYLSAAQCRERAAEIYVKEGLHPSAARSLQKAGAHYLHGNERLRAATCFDRAGDLYDSCEENFQTNCYFEKSIECLAQAVEQYRFLKDSNAESKSTCHIADILQANIDH